MNKQKRPLKKNDYQTTLGKLAEAEKLLGEVNPFLERPSRQHSTANSAAKNANMPRCHEYGKGKYYHKQSNGEYREISETEYTALAQQSQQQNSTDLNRSPL